MFSSSLRKFSNCNSAHTFSSTLSISSAEPCTTSVCEWKGRGLPYFENFKRRRTIRASINTPSDDMWPRLAQYNSISLVLIDGFSLFGELGSARASLKDVNQGFFLKHDYCIPCVLLCDWTCLTWFHLVSQSCSLWIRSANLSCFSCSSSEASGRACSQQLAMPCGVCLVVDLPLPQLNVFVCAFLPLWFIYVCLCCAH